MPGDNAYLRVERKDDTEKRQKLAPIAEGPFPVKKVDKDNKTLLLERPDKTVENVSRSCVVLAPKGPSCEQLLEATRPITMRSSPTSLHRNKTTSVTSEQTNQTTRARNRLLKAMNPSKRNPERFQKKAWQLAS